LTDAAPTGAPPPRASRRQWLGFVSIVGGIAALALAVGVLLVLSRLGACACTPVSQTPSIPSSVEGVLVAVDSAGLNDVRGFDLRTTDGRTLRFKLGQLENPTEFPPGHLAEHLANSSPVRVSFYESNRDLVAYRLEDAEQSPAPSGSSAR
jgi:hypothetical protein